MSTMIFNQPNVGSLVYNWKNCPRVLFKTIDVEKAHNRKFLGVHERDRSHL